MFCSEINDKNNFIVDDFAYNQISPPQLLLALYLFITLISPH